MSKNQGNIGQPGGINKTGKFVIPDAQTIAGTTAATSFANNVLVTSGAFTTQIRNGLTNQTHKNFWLWDSTKARARAITNVFTNDRLEVSHPFEKQVMTFTPAVVESTDIFGITMPDTSSITFTATAGTVANVTAGLKAAWDAEAIATPKGDFAKYSVADDGLTINCTSIDYDKFVKHTASISTSAVDGGGTDTQTLTKNVTEDGEITADIAVQIVENAKFRSVGVVAESGDITMFEDQTLSEGSSESYEEAAGLTPIYGDAAANTATISTKQ